MNTKQKQRQNATREQKEKQITLEEQTDAFQRFAKQMAVIEECLNLLLLFFNSDELSTSSTFSLRHEILYIVHMKLIQVFGEDSNFVHLLVSNFPNPTDFMKQFKKVLQKFLIQPRLLSTLIFQFQSPVHFENITFIFEICNKNVFEEMDLGKTCFKLIKSKGLVKGFVEFFLQDYVKKTDIAQNDKNEFEMCPTVASLQIQKLVKMGDFEFVKEAISLYPNIAFSSSVLSVAKSTYVQQKTEDTKKIFYLISEKYNKFPFQNKNHKTICTTIQNFSKIDSSSVPDPIKQIKEEIVLYIPVFFESLRNYSVNKYFDPQTKNVPLFDTTTTISFINDNYTKTLIKQLHIHFEIDTQWYKNQLQYISSLSKEDKYTLYEYSTDNYKYINEYLYNNSNFEDTVSVVFEMIQHYADFQKKKLPKLLNDIHNTKTKSKSFKNKKKENYDILKINEFIINESDESQRKQNSYFFHVPFFVQFCEFFKMPTSTNSNVILQKASLLSKDEFKKVFPQILEMIAKSMSKIIQNAPPTTKPFFVFRGTNKDVHNLTNDSNKTINLNSFMSTSLSLSVAIQFADDAANSEQNNIAHKKCCLNIFEVKPGTKCVFMEPVCKIRNEVEVLFDYKQKIYLEKSNLEILYQSSKYHETQKDKDFDKDYSKFHQKVCSSEQYIMKVNKLSIGSFNNNNTLGIKMKQ